MKVSATLLTVAGLTAVAVAADASSTVSVSLTPQQTCVAACDPSDVSCQAECFGNPGPDASMVNATTECAAACPQGSGSPSDTQKYSDCVQACIKSDFFSSTLGATGAGAAASATATGTAATATGTAKSGASAAASAASSGSSAVKSGSVGSGSSGSGSSASSTASGSQASASGNAAVGLQSAGSLTGILAILAAAIAL